MQKLPRVKTTWPKGGFLKKSMRMNLKRLGLKKILPGVGLKKRSGSGI